MKVCATTLALLFTFSLWAQSADSAKLVPIKTEPPIYPLVAQKQGIQGQVWVKISVNERGSVDKVDVISGDPALTKAAADAAKKWRFQPFIKNGKAIKVTAQMPVDFAFRNKIMEKGVSADMTATVDTHAAREIPPDVPTQVGGAPAQRIRVSRGIEQALLVHQVAPVYPPEAREQHLEGTVIFQALIGRDGRVRDLKPLSGPKQLIPAAIGAVQQWRYRPYLLMGQPMEVETQITVSFTLPPPAM
jgi:TonB family protein